MGCGWNPICHVKNAAESAWDWLTGDGAWGWIRAFLIMVSIGAALAGLVFIAIGATLFFEIAISILAVAAFFLFIYSIATRKKTNPT